MHYIRKERKSYESRKTSVGEKLNHNRTKTEQGNEWLHKWDYKIVCLFCWSLGVNKNYKSFLHWYWLQLVRCIGLTKVHKMLIFDVITYRETLSRNTMGDPLIWSYLVSCLIIFSIEPAPSTQLCAMVLCLVTVFTLGINPHSNIRTSWFLNSLQQC